MQYWLYAGGWAILKYEGNIVVEIVSEQVYELCVVAQEETED